MTEPTQQSDSTPQAAYTGPPITGLTPLQARVVLLLSWGALLAYVNACVFGLVLSVGPWIKTTAWAGVFGFAPAAIILGIAHLEPRTISTATRRNLLGMFASLLHVCAGGAAILAAEAESPFGQLGTLAWSGVQLGLLEGGLRLIWIWAPVGLLFGQLLSLIAPARKRRNLSQGFGNRPRPPQFAGGT
jgi:hypothetical protein